MPTVAGYVQDDAVRLEAAVTGGTGMRPVRGEYESILDTGATVSLVSPRVVRETDLTPIGFTQIVPASGVIAVTPVYQVRLDILAGHEWRGWDRVIVARLPYQPSDYDVLLGMDLIRGCHFTMFGGQFFLSS